MPPGDAARRRGLLVHRLLEVLPGVPDERRVEQAERLLAGTADPALAEAVLREAETVLADPALTRIFGAGSRAEVAIVGELSAETGRYAVSGRVDRLARDADGWHLVDFKTDRNVPDTATEVAPAYVLQMALYRRLLMDMEAGVPVSATLVFTSGAPVGGKAAGSGAKVVPLPAEMMENALEGLKIRANPVP